MRNSIERKTVFGSQRLARSCSGRLARTLRVPIITYHYIDSRPVLGPWGGKFTLDPAKFSAEMDYLQPGDVLSLRDAYAWPRVGIGPFESSLGFSRALVTAP